MLFLVFVITALITRLPDLPSLTNTSTTLAVRCGGKTRQLNSGSQPGNKLRGRSTVTRGTSVREHNGTRRYGPRTNPIDGLWDSRFSPAGTVVSIVQLWCIITFRASGQAAGWSHYASFLDVLNFFGPHVAVLANLVQAGARLADKLLPSNFTSVELLILYMQVLRGVFTNRYSRKGFFEYAVVTAYAYGRYNYHILAVTAFVMAYINRLSWLPLRGVCLLCLSAVMPVFGIYTGVDMTVQSSTFVHILCLYLLCYFYDPSYLAQLPRLPKRRGHYRTPLSVKCYAVVVTLIAVCAVCGCIYLYSNRITPVCPTQESVKAKAVSYLNQTMSYMDKAKQAVWKSGTISPTTPLPVVQQERPPALSGFIMFGSVAIALLYVIVIWRCRRKTASNRKTARHRSTNSVNVANKKPLDGVKIQIVVEQPGKPSASSKTKKIANVKSAASVKKCA